MEPASQEEDKTPVSVDLECLQCHAQARIHLSEEKFKQLSSSWKIIQPCEVCNTHTEWSFAEVAVQTDEQVDFWDWLATTGEYFGPAGGQPQHERRKEPRLDLRVPIRVAASDGQEEEVTSENISKSGLCFLSRRTYRPGENVRVTVEPPGVLAPQTKLATIVRVEAAGKGMTLYGARVSGNTETDSEEAGG